MFRKSLLCDNILCSQPFCPLSSRPCMIHTKRLSCRTCLQSSACILSYIHPHIRHCMNHTTLFHRLVPFTCCTFTSCCTGMFVGFAALHNLLLLVSCENEKKSYHNHKWFNRKLHCVLLKKVIRNKFNLTNPFIAWIVIYKDVKSKRKIL